MNNESSLFNLSNCLVTPHIAWDDEKTRIEPFEICLLNLINGIYDKPLIHEIIIQ